MKTIYREMFKRKKKQWRSETRGNQRKTPHNISSCQTLNNLRSSAEDSVPHTSSGPCEEPESRNIYSLRPIGHQLSLSP